MSLKYPPLWKIVLTAYELCNFDPVFVNAHIFRIL
jgi:hypothetical protein